MSQGKDRSSASKAEVCVRLRGSAVRFFSVFSVPLWLIVFCCQLHLPYALCSPKNAIGLYVRGGGGLFRRGCGI
jgi:hypothetical protein